MTYWKAKQTSDCTQQVDFLFCHQPDLFTCIQPKPAILKKPLVVNLFPCPFWTVLRTDLQNLFIEVTHTVALKITESNDFQ